MPQGLGRGYLLSGLPMRAEPPIKRTVAFIDGQNLFHAAREAFGHIYPNYDVRALALAVCRARNWALEQVRFYTGVPDRTDDAFWNQFWAAKLLSMSRQRIHVYSRSLRYRDKRVRLPLANATRASTDLTPAA
jgi:hypothetical protein